MVGRATGHRPVAEAWFWCALALLGTIHGPFIRTALALFVTYPSRQEDKISWPIRFLPDDTLVLRFFFVKNIFKHFEKFETTLNILRTFCSTCGTFFIVANVLKKIKKFQNIWYKFTKQFGKFQTIRNVAELFHLCEHFEKFETTPKWWRI